MQQTVCCQENQFTTYYLLTLWRGNAQGFRILKRETLSGGGDGCRSYMTQFINDILFDKKKRKKISLSLLLDQIRLLRAFLFLSLSQRLFAFAAILRCNCSRLYRGDSSFVGFYHRSRPKIYFRLRALATSLNKTIMKAAEFDRRELIGDS